MRILNVIEMLSGIIKSIESFAIYDEQLSTEVIQNAHDNFKEKIENSIGTTLEDDEIQEYVINQCFDDNNGYEVILIWSEI